MSHPQLDTRKLNCTFLNKEEHMKTTQQWISEIKSSPEKLVHWLERQYIGEALAAERIQSLANTTEGRFGVLLAKIAEDERNHCEWVHQLLISRNISTPVPSYDGTRYWEPILDHVHSFSELAGIGYHAESMRLARIEALAADSEISSDIREVFAKILPDEQNHARWFELMSTPEDIEKTKALHSKGLEVLGLEM